MQSTPRVDRSEDVSHQTRYERLQQPESVETRIESASKSVSRFRNQGAIGIGVALMVCGLIGIVFNAVDIGLYQWTAGIIGHGFWIGAVMIATGATGVATGVRRTIGLIHSFNVLCIVAASLCTIQLIISVISSVAESTSYRCRSTESEFRSYYYPCARIAIVMQASLAVLAVVEAVLAICGSVLCCKAACCCTNCCENPDSTTVAQTLIVNDVPLTVIYQSQSRSISVHYAAPVPNSSLSLHKSNDIGSSHGTTQSSEPPDH